MELEDSHKKLKKRKNSKKNIEKNLKMEISQFPESEDNSYRGNEDKNKKKFTGDKGDTKTVELSNIEEESDAPGVGKKKSKKLRAEKKKNGKIARAELNEVSTPCNDEDQDEFADQKGTPKEAGEHKMQKLMKMKRKNARTLDVGEVDKLVNDEGRDEFTDKKDTSNEGGESKTQKKMKKKRKNTRTIGISEVDKLNTEGEYAAEPKKGNSKKARTVKKEQLLINQSSLENSLEKKGEAAQDVVYEMSSGDEDSSKGMKKWIMEYHRSRPGLKVLQERIDDFIAAHEAQEEQSRREREAKAAEGGWTVVIHHKGRKKTSDAESGTVVGSVAQAAVLDKMAKKKNKDAGPDFYRFQKREAHRNEIMMLQSKFEQDKKRIQQMRAERKFRPY